jgi:hypothetical protein
MSAWGNTDALASKPKVEARKVTFDGTSTSVVSTSAETIEIRGTSFVTGDAVVYTSTGAIGGLTSGTTYYVIRVDSDTIKLASSLSNANAGTAINLSAVGTGTADTLQLVRSDIYGVNKSEAAANKLEEGFGHVGWNKIVTVGSRKKVETLVAMSKNFATATDLEDTVFQDYLIVIGTQPANDESATGDAVTFTVAATTTPTGGTIGYQWAVSTDDGDTWSNLSNTGVYSTVTTATLNISDNTGLDGNQYRCTLSVTGATDVTSSAATLTEAA